MKKLMLILALAVAATTLFAGDITRTGMHQGDLYTVLNDLVQATSYANLTDPGLAIGSGSKKKVLVTNTSTVRINGEFKSVTTAEVTLAGTSLAASQECIFSICNSGTAFSAVQGRIVATGLTPEIPRPTAATALIGYMKVVTDSTGAFVPGTTDLDYASATVTYVDLGCYPPKLTDL
jgi:hypothetical protein